MTRTMAGIPARTPWRGFLFRRGNWRLLVGAVRLISSLSHPSCISPHYHGFLLTNSYIRNNPEKMLILS